MALVDFHQDKQPKIDLSASLEKFCDAVQGFTLTYPVGFAVEMSSPKDYPVEIPPPGQSSNFNDPKSRGPATAAVCYIFVSLMWPILFSRLYSKVFILRKFGWDDGKPNPQLTFCLLICDNSVCYTSRSISHFSKPIMRLSLIFRR